MTDLSILNEQNLRILLGGLSDWCFHMRKHLGTNATNYFMYQWAGPVRCPLPLNHQALPSHTSQSAQKESLTIRG